MTSEIGSLLEQMLGVGNGPVPARAQDQFHQIAQRTSPEALSEGLGAAFASEQTPSFGTMVAHMFGHADPAQKTGIINRLLSGLGTSAGSVLSRIGIPGMSNSPVVSNVTTEQAMQVSPDQVQQLATHAQTANPGIVATMSNFYAQHPVLVKTLGAAALSLILGRIGNAARR